VAALLETARQGGHRVEVSGSGETECADSCQGVLRVLDWILSDGERQGPREQETKGTARSVSGGTPPLPPARKRILFNDMQ
jgi:hypothetical protein